MKFYYSPHACSLACHIALREAGIKFEAIPVDLKTQKVGSTDYKSINPKGYVPAIVLDNGQLMTEGVAIMQWAADQAQSKNLLPAWGTPERYKAIEWLNFLATEIHKGFGPFWANHPEDLKTKARETLTKRFSIIEAQLSKNDFILGNQFSVVDGYLFTMLQWAKHHKLEMSAWPKLMGLSEKVKIRPAVQEVLKTEGAK